MTARSWKIGDKIVDLSKRGMIMGVLNVTPDSFSEGGEFFEQDAAIERGIQSGACSGSCFCQNPDDWAPPGKRCMFSGRPARYGSTVEAITAA